MWKVVGQIESFLNANLFDEIRVFRSPNQLFKGIAAPNVPKNVDLIEKQNLLGDELSIYKHR